MIFNILQIFVVDTMLKKYLKKKNRFFGKLKSYDKII